MTACKRGPSKPKPAMTQNPIRMVFAGASIATGFRLTAAEEDRISINHKVWGSLRLLVQSTENPDHCTYHDPRRPQDVGQGSLRM